MTGLRISDGKKHVEEISIQGQQVKVHHEWINQDELLFYPKNPRVYSALDTASKDPSQDEIQRHMLSLDHVKNLVKSIKDNGGLLEPIIVHGGSKEVIEGNSRLAAYRKLEEEDSVRWRKIRCIVLPNTIEERLIFSYLGQIHIAGRKNWMPYEQAGLLYRRHKEHGVEVEALAKEVGRGAPTIKKYLEAYGMMLDNDDNKPSKWSFYYEYCKSRKIQTARNKFPELDKVILDKIKFNEQVNSDEIIAEDIRDKLPSILEGPKKVLKNFMNGKLTMDEAYEKVEEAGGNDVSMKKVVGFENWLKDDDTSVNFEKMSKENKDKIAFSLGRIASQAQQLARRLKSPDKKR